MAPLFSAKKTEWSRGVVGVAGGKVLTLLLKFIEPRLLPPIDNRLCSGWKEESRPGDAGDEEPNEMMEAGGWSVLVAALEEGVKVRSICCRSGDGRPNVLDRRKNRVRAREACTGVSQSAESLGDDGLCVYEAAVGVLELDLQLNSLTVSGAAKVSLPIEGRERKVLRLKLLSLERRLDAPCPFVGVGGMSSTLVSLSTMLSTIVRLAVGDWLSGRSSSPSTLMMLPRRPRDPPMLPKTLVPLPKDYVENLDTCALNGVLVVPN